MRGSALPALLLALMLAACGLPRNVVVLIPDQDGGVGKVTVAQDKNRTELSKPDAAVGTAEGEPARPFIADDGVVRSEFASTLASTPRQPKVFVIYFRNGLAAIDPRSDQTLKDAVAAALATPHPDISVIGHTDATGDDAVNLPLSMQRAAVVQLMLLGAGVPKGAVETGYFGSSDPRVPTPQGVPEPENRRVEVTIR
ncbi:MAG TPA: OmpA family protein [Acetobacteraceae bacterium]|nr:OmpA family protein [Acetobacteraceae bacterium]